MFSLFWILWSCGEELPRVCIAYAQETSLVRASQWLRLARSWSLHELMVKLSQRVKSEERSVADDQCSLLEVGKPSADGEIISRSVGISSDKIYKQPPRVLQHHQVRHHSSSFSSNISVTHTLYSQPKDSCKLPSKSLLVCEISKQ